jgi:hypothetical protein
MLKLLQTLLRLEPRRERSARLVDEGMGAAAIPKTQHGPRREPSRAASRGRRSSRREHGYMRAKVRDDDDARARTFSSLDRDARARRAASDARASAASIANARTRERDD